MTKSERRTAAEAYSADPDKQHKTRYYGFIKPRLHGEFTLTVYAVSDTKTHGLRVVEVNRAWSDRPYYVCKNLWRNLWGNTSVEFDEDCNRDYIRRPESQRYHNRWGDKIPWNGKGNNANWFIPYVRYRNLDALASTKYRYCAFDRYSGGLSLVEYCRLFNRHKEIELLAKSHLDNFIEPRFLDRLSVDKPLHDFFRSSATQLRHGFTPRHVMSAHRHGWTLDRAREIDNINRELQRAPKGVNRLELHRYLTANDIDLYDYINYAKDIAETGRDIHAFGVAFPRDFHAAAIDAQMEREKTQSRRRRAQLRKAREAERERRRLHDLALMETAKRINHLLERMKNRLAWRVGDLSAIVPVTKQDFIDEGNTMRNCIGGYYDRHAEGSTFCFFIRKDGKPFADVEMAPSTGSIRQCRLFANAEADAATRNFAETMAKKFAATMNQIKKAA